MGEFFITMDNSENKNCATFTLDEAYDRFEMSRKACNLAEDSISTYYDSYNYFCEFLTHLKNEHDIQIDRCDQVYKEIIEDYTIFMKEYKTIKDNTINTRIVGIRTFFKFCFEKGHIPPFEIPLMLTQQEIKQVYSDGEMEALLVKPDMSVTKFTEYRNWFAVVFFYETGVRIKTLVNMRIEDLLFDQNKIVIRVQKNKRITYIHMSPMLKEYLQEYLSYRKGNPSDYLFCSIHGRKITTNGMRTAINKYNKRKSISKTSAHLIRHRHSMDFIAAGGNIKELQLNLGHASIKTTEEYLKGLGVDINRAYDNVSPLASKLKKQTDKRLPSLERISMAR